MWFGLSNSQKTVVVPLYCANTEVPVSWTIVNRSDKTVDEMPPTSRDGEQAF